MFYLPLLCLFLPSILFSALIGADQKEVAVSKAPGNDSEPPRVWYAVRTISSDAAKLRTLCERAHSHTGSPDTDVIDRVSFMTEMISLTLPNEPALGKEFEIADIVSYNITRLKQYNLPSSHYFHFTKGEEGCVQYLIRWRRNKPFFRYGPHFCGVEVPV